MKLISLLAASVLAIGAAPAAASVTLGQVASNPGASGFVHIDFTQLSVAAGPSYTVPGNGTITSWSNNAPVAGGQSLKFKVFRKVADPYFYRQIGHDGPQPIASGLLNTFATSIPVQAGDLIGLESFNLNSAEFSTSALPGDTVLARSPSLVNDGDSASFEPNNARRLNLSAVFVPSNTVTVGTSRLNKKKGTATLNLTLPNPGELTASGKGVKASSAGGAAISKAVGAGAATLLIKAKGKKRKRLNETGKVKANVTIIYTPVNGDPGTQSVKVKLKKR